jgi:surfeit locus 1 family protein
MTGAQPRLGPALFTAAVTLVCLALGFWQVQRLHWKEGLIAAREAALAAPPVAPPHDSTEARALDLRRIADQGTFLNAKETLVYAIGPDGAAGFDVLTPLREPSGRLVLVNRGFVPTALKDPATRQAGEPKGMVRIAGLVRLAPTARPGWFTPENRPQSGDWYWVDQRAIADAAGLPALAPFYIDADATPNPGGWPKGRAQLPPLPNSHLQYAITWFSLAVAAVAIFLLSQRRREPGVAEPERNDGRVRRT